MTAIDFRTDRGRRTDVHWTRDRIIEALQAFHATMGRAPSTTDVNFNLPSRRAKFSAARIAEAERAYDLGLRLPCATICRREFGTWPAAVRAAGLTPNPVGVRFPQPHLAGLRNTSSLTICPSCGDGRWRMDEITGWCADCTREHHEMGRAA